MKKLARAILGLLLVLLSTSSATGNGLLGEFVGDVGIHANDTFADGHDRYRSHASQKSYFFRSRTRGFETQLRYRLEIISPASTNYNPSDRPYVGAIGLAGFLHGAIGNNDFRVGGEVLLVGDQTGLGVLQQAVHDAVGLSGTGRVFMPSESQQPSIDNMILPMIQLELSRNLRLGKRAVLRPFVEGQLGYENKLTLGADFIVGRMSANRRWAREVVTGSIQGTKQGIFRLHNRRDISLVAGFDVAFVSSSAFIPDSNALTLEPIRYRARLGIQTTVSESFSIFLGQAWLSREFRQQQGGQRIGVLAFDLRF